jgi:DNA-binding NtrC family response regulator
MSRRVIIVDDSETCAETLGIALESIQDVEIRIVKSARAARQALQEPGEVAAMITDLDMPDSNGLELIDEVRAEARFARLPILMISGNSDPRSAERALARGATAYFAKPYSPAAVRRKLEQLVCPTCTETVSGSAAEPRSESAQPLSGQAESPSGY